MRILKHFMIFTALILVAPSLFANLEKGKALPSLNLEGDAGGHLDGSSWNSDSMKGHPSVLYYVDPDEKDKNEDLSEALKKRDFPKDKVKFYAIINMGATWLPNFAISNSLKSKQKKYPNTTYLKDNDKKAVKEWDMADDENNVVVFNAKGEVLFSKFGKLDAEEIKELIAIVEKELQNKAE